ncbi:hypothetical protein [Bosea sp. MMO-172]|uniref:hypothetical protein n=1 Tax=Bosea sp. MMO-172 TaxID=3127885 RepID=UPI00301A689C
MEPSVCRRLAIALARLARKADELEAQAELMPELEDELLAVASDIDAVAPASIEPGYQAALREQQRELQRQLDGGGPVHVSRPGLAALAMPIGDTNVIAMPIAPRPRPLGGGDAV